MIDEFVIWDDVFSSKERTLGAECFLSLGGTGGGEGLTYDPAFVVMSGSFRFLLECGLVISFVIPIK